MPCAATPGSACPATSVLMPTTRPARSISGPPELPGLIGALVWMALNKNGPVVVPLPGSCTVRPSALTTPAVTVGPPGSASALPIATTQSPTCNWSESPSWATGRSSAVIWITARSVCGSRPMSVAVKVRPSVSETASCCAPSMTWLLVRMWPSAS
jgi:hypothetical protein